ncbi:MAG: acetate--CoA ligase family protein [Candidatus Micrarchaeota archaeon]|nr:acetate--CoA ligase family protein [Candidatus Micrarchaeota archaeon]
MDFSLLSKYKIPHPKYAICNSAEDAAKSAAKIGFPVVLKVNSKTIVHKSDKGGVLLNIANQQQLKAGYSLLLQRFPEIQQEGVLVQKMVKSQDAVELIVGGKKDKQFGQLIMVGLGGIFVETFHDVSFRICPISRSDAEEMLKELKAYPLLLGARGRKPANISAVISTMLRVSDLLLAEDPLEFDLNPVIADDKGCVAVDVRLLK